LQSFDGIWEEELRNMMKRKEEAPEPRPEEVLDSNLVRTCTVTLRQILRPDLRNQYEEIVRTLRQMHEQITNVIDELSVLAHQTTLLVSQCEWGGDVTFNLLLHAMNPRS
jgi:hypothetical protein